MRVSIFGAYKLQNCGIAPLPHCFFASRFISYPLFCCNQAADKHSSEWHIMPPWRVSRQTKSMLAQTLRLSAPGSDAIFSRAHCSAAHQKNGMLARAGMRAIAHLGLTLGVAHERQYNTLFLPHRQYQALVPPIVGRRAHALVVGAADGRESDRARHLRFVHQTAWFYFLLRNNASLPRA